MNTETDIAEYPESIESLIQEFTDIHNHIISSLNAAEKGHAETLSVFLDEMQIRLDRAQSLTDSMKRLNVSIHQASGQIHEVSKTAKYMDDQLNAWSTRSRKEVAAVIKDTVKPIKYLSMVNVLVLICLLAFMVWRF